MIWIDWLVMGSILIVFSAVGLVVFTLCEMYGHRIVPTLDSWLDFLRSKSEREFRQFHRHWYYDLLRMPVTAWEKIPGKEKDWPTFEAWQNGIFVAKLSVERFKDAERCEDIIVCSIPVETIVRRLVTLSFADGHSISGCCRYCPVPNGRCKFVDWLYKDILLHRCNIPLKQEVAES